jgi:hypothetical protein
LSAQLFLTGKNFSTAAAFWIGIHLRKTHNIVKENKTERDKKRQRETERQRERERKNIGRPHPFVAYNGPVKKLQVA